MSSYLHFLSVGGPLLQPLGFGDGIGKVWTEPMALVPKSAQAFRGTRSAGTRFCSPLQWYVVGLNSPVGMFLGDHYVNPHQAQKIDVS